MVTHLIELGLYKPSGLLIRHPLQDLKVHGSNLDTDKKLSTHKKSELKGQNNGLLEFKNKIKIN